MRVYIQVPDSEQRCLVARQAQPQEVDCANE